MSYTSGLFLEFQLTVCLDMILLANIATQRISALNNLIKRKNKKERNLIDIFKDLSLVHFSDIFLP